MLTKETEIIERKIGKNDRCDSCGAEAFVLVKMISGELMFCGHHYMKNQKALNKQSYEIVDERSHINEKPSQSSN
jgi:hypothetical protein